MSNNRMIGAAAALLLALALPATAKTYCCTDKTGKRVCGDTFPEQCEDRAYKEFGAKGSVRNVEAPLTAEQKAQREAEEAQKKEQLRLVAEQQRRDRALLNTYATEQDIDYQRDRALAENDKAAQELRNKLDAALKAKKRLDQELEFYAKKPVPPALKAQIKENELDIQAKQAALDAKKGDADAIRAKFEDDRKRYRELNGGKR